VVREPLRLAAAMTVIVQSAACLGFDLVGPAPRDPAGSGTIRISERDVASGTAQFGLVAGFDDAGSPRTVQNPLLLVNGRPIGPTSSSAETHLAYDMALTPAEMDVDWLHIRFPDAGGREASVSVPRVTREGPSAIAATHDGDIVLPLRFPPEFAAWTTVGWNLLLRERCDGGPVYTHVQGSRLPTGQVVIPLSLRGDAPAEFEACFSISYRSEGGGSGYRILIMTSVDMEWRIAAAEAPHSNFVSAGATKGIAR
jgi:hypothetical protein